MGVFVVAPDEFGSFGVQRCARIAKMRKDCRDAQDVIRLCWDGKQDV